MSDLNKTIFRAEILTCNRLRDFYNQAYALLSAQGLNPTPEIRAYVKACYDRLQDAERQIDELLEQL